AVVEQQIGRVDRMGSLWQQLLERAIECPEEPVPMPRIQVRPVVFEGTYDERQWRVLQYRWQTLRSQLHGEILPECDAADVIGVQLRNRVAEAAPCFSPAQSRR
ncbi:type III restriction endonuclease subunit R, partial [Stenotrophomonas sp. HMWF022]